MANRHLTVYREIRQHQATGSVDLLTIHYHFHILDKTMDNFENLCSGLRSFFLRQSFQPLDHRLHFLLPNKLSNAFFFVQKSGNKFPRRQ